jgi:predicted glycosyltransferase
MRERLRSLGLSEMWLQEQISRKTMAERFTKAQRRPYASRNGKEQQFWESIGETIRLVLKATLSI